MKIQIAVDANIIISALLGGKARFALFNKQYQFITTDFNISEVKKYLPLLVEETGSSEEELLNFLYLLPLTVTARQSYTNQLTKAKNILKGVDIHDANLLALALKLNTPIWSQDKHFQKIKTHLVILNTEDLI